MLKAALSAPTVNSQVLRSEGKLTAVLPSVLRRRGIGPGEHSGPGNERSVGDLHQGDPIWICFQKAEMERPAKGMPNVTGISTKGTLVSDGDHLGGNGDSWSRGESLVRDGGPQLPPIKNPALLAKHNDPV